MSDEGKEEKEEAEFYESLGSRGPIKSAKKGGDDEAFEHKQARSSSLFKYVFFF